MGPIETLTFGWIGIALAGGLYPIVQMCLRTATPRIPGAITDLVLFGLLAFVAGSMYAGVAAIVAVAVAWLFAVLAQIRGTPIWLASLTGGWTGFLCSLAFGGNFTGYLWFDVLLATVLGQAGAAWIADIAVERNRHLVGVEPQREERLRIGLRQLFGATTFVCIVAAAVGAARPTREIYMLIGAASLLQFAMIVAAIIGCRIRRWRRAVQAVSREALTRSAQVSQSGAFHVTRQ